MPVWVPFSLMPFFVECYCFAVTGSWDLWVFGGIAGAMSEGIRRMFSEIFEVISKKKSTPVMPQTPVEIPWGIFSICVRNSGGNPEVIHKEIP